MNSFRLLPLLLFLAGMGCMLPSDTLNRTMYRMDQQDRMVTGIAPFQSRDSLLGIYIKVNAQKMLFTRQPDGSFTASLGVHVSIVGDYESTVVLDSASFLSSVRYGDRNKFAVFHFDMPVRHHGELLAKIICTDLNRGVVEDQYLSLQLTAGVGRNAFLASDKESVPLFSNHFSATDSFSIRYADSTVTAVTCKFFKRDFPLASPPFGVDDRQPFDYKPDSVFSVPVNDGTLLTFREKGFYHFQSDTTVKSGFTLFCFDDGYPKIVSTRQMLGPLRYLTVRSEYQTIEASSSLRKSIDQFWLDRCKGSKEKSRLLIQKFYNRVQQANVLFGSYTEGWRTDRGMLYTVLGPPNTIFRTSTSESWVYGTVNSPTSLNFMFIKVDNPFTDNDYSLTRSPFYETPWFRAVDVWRQGRAYNN